MKLNGTVKIIPGYEGLKKSTQHSKYVCTNNRGCIFDRREFVRNFNVEVDDCDVCIFSKWGKAKENKHDLKTARKQAVGALRDFSNEIDEII